MLKGIRILDFTRLLPGPFGTLMLSALGAEVIKVEDPQGGDYLRWMPPKVGEYSAIFDYLNLGKKSISVNLKSDRGREIILDIAKNVDAVVEQFRPGVMDKLGLGYDSLKKVNPGIVYCSLSGYGQEGPLKDRAGHDLNYISYAGILGLNGRNMPEPPPIQVADLTGGIFLALGTLAGVLKSRSEGTGCYLDVSMLATSLSFISPYLVNVSLTGEELQPAGHQLTGAVACYNVYQTADGRYISLGALEPKFWNQFIEATGREDLREHQFSPARDGHEGYEKIKELFRSKTLEEWLGIFSNYDACVAPVLTLSETLKATHLNATGRIVECQLEKGKKVRVPVPPLTDGKNFQKLSPAPHLGQHTREILENIGYNSDEINQLMGEGIVHAQPQSPDSG